MAYIAMNAIHLAEAKARLSELVDMAEAGEEIYITRRGKLVARLISARAERKGIHLAEMRAVTDRMPSQPEDAASFVRRMREEDLY
jgi:prevent-host-death family protein